MNSTAKDTGAHDTSDRRLILLLRVATAACFAAWAWQHLRWVGPYAAPLRNPDLFGFVEKLGIDWIHWINELVTDERILLLSKGIGVFYLVVAIAATFVDAQRRFLHVVLWLGGLSLCATSASIAVHGLSGVLWLEHVGQFVSPILLSLALLHGPRSQVVLVAAVVAFWAVFLSHGLFATGILPIPGPFLSMTQGILHLGEQGSVTFLQVVGILDFTVCFACLVPALRKPAFAYACLWGLLTALARPLAGMSISAPFWGADAYLHEALLRLPHAAIPAFLYFAWAGERVSAKEYAGRSAP